MKMNRSARCVALFYLCVAALPVWLHGQIRPRYVPTQITVVLREDTTVSGSVGKTPADLIQAMGAASSRQLAGSLSGFYFIELPPGSRLGRAFAIAQAFEFGPRWSLRVLEPNYISQASIGEPIPENGAVRVFNLSMRAEVRTGEGTTIGGIVVPGSFAQLVVFRVRGPSLTAFGIAQALPNPILRLYEGAQLILQNDDWSTLRDFEKTMARRACLPPEHPLDAMLVTYLDPSVNYTAIVSSAGGETGIAIVEVFILDEFYIGSNTVTVLPR